MSFLEIFKIFFRLGCISFGGPIAHLSFFREEFVSKKNLMTEEKYSDLVALCQFLPGPASSQVGMGVGNILGGAKGAIAAWIGFTLPSALIMFFLAYGFTEVSIDSSWVHSLKVAAVAIVAHAVIGMMKGILKTPFQWCICIFATLFILLFSSAFNQIFIIIFSGLVGFLFLRNKELNLKVDPPKSNHSSAKYYILTFFILLVLAPLLKWVLPNFTTTLFDGFYRVGSLVFGGGHVVLPMLEEQVITFGNVSNDLFLAGYGFSNALPGPLFSLSSYLGFLVAPEGLKWWGALLAIFAIFLPSFLLIMGVTPYWEVLKTRNSFQRALIGINASVVGLLIAALYNPVATSALYKPFDYLVALICFMLLKSLKKGSLWAIAFSVIIYHSMKYLQYL